MIKPGDLVTLADDTWKVPGALSAIKYFKNLQDDYSGKTMIVLEVREKPPIRYHIPKDFEREAFVLVDRTVKRFDLSLLKVIK